MAVIENDYAAYIQTPDGEVPLRDLDAQEKIGSLSEDSAPPIVETYNGQTIQCSMSADRPLKGLNLYATCKQKTTTGAQLFNFNEVTYSNCNLQDAKTGTIKSNIINSYYCSIFIENLNEYLMENKGEQFCLRVNDNENKKISIVIYGTDESGYKTQESDVNGRFTSIVINDDFTSITRIELRFNRLPEAFTDTETIIGGIMFYKGNSDIAFEPYTGGIPSPNGDYPQEIQSTSDFVVEVKNSMGAGATPQTLDITIPGQGFYGIPVSSGGNYTDASGQQWICDEFDFANKKFIKRVGRVSYDGAENEEWVLNAAAENKTRFYINLANGKIASGSKCLCNRLIYGISGASGACFVSNSRFYIDIEASINTVALLRDYLNTHPLDVIYTLETPVEYNLTDEEIEQYKKLRSYYGTTHIDNDAVPACNMQAELVLDTKLYIDSKFTTLAGQIIEDSSFIVNGNEEPYPSDGTGNQDNPDDVIDEPEDDLADDFADDDDMI